MDMPVDEHPPLLVRDLQVMMDTSRHVAYASLLAHIVAGVRQSSGLILNTFNAIERTDVEQIRRDTAIRVFPVGPLHMLSPPATAATQKSSLLPEDRSCLEWLNTQLPGSVLFVSFGTLASIDADELLEVAWGLAASNRPFLWVVRPRLVRGRDSVELPSELLEETRGRGRIIRWAPQEEVLSHPAIGAFLTHSGWNSTLESISRTVPMICKPCGGDQLGTASGARDTAASVLDPPTLLSLLAVATTVCTSVCERSSASASYTQSPGRHPVASPRRCPASSAGWKVSTAPAFSTSSLLFPKAGPPRACNLVSSTPLPTPRHLPGSTTHCQSSTAHGQPPSSSSPNPSYPNPNRMLPADVGGVAGAGEEGEPRQSWRRRSDV